jgi:hypothetical protein
VWLQCFDNEDNGLLFPCLDLSTFERCPCSAERFPAQEATLVTKNQTTAGSTFRHSVNVDGYPYEVPRLYTQRPGELECHGNRLYDVHSNREPAYGSPRHIGPNHQGVGELPRCRRLNP